MHEVMLGGWTLGVDAQRTRNFYGVVDRIDELVGTSSYDLPPLSDCGSNF